MENKNHLLLFETIGAVSCFHAMFIEFVDGNENKNNKKNWARVQVTAPGVRAFRYATIAPNKNLLTYTQAEGIQRKGIKMCKDLHQPQVYGKNNNN